MSGNTSKRYPAELKARAVRMYAEIRPDQETDWGAMARVAELLGVSTAETVRKWVRQAEVDQGERPGTTSEESAEIKRLKRENAELKRANAILKAARLSSRQYPQVRSGSVRSFLRCSCPGSVLWLVAVRPMCGAAGPALPAGLVVA